MKFLAEPGWIFLVFFFVRESVAGFSRNMGSDKQSGILFARIWSWEIFVHPLSKFSAKHLFLGWLETAAEADEGRVLSSHSSAEKLNPALSYDIQYKCVFVCVLG